MEDNKEEAKEVKEGGEEQKKETNPKYKTKLCRHFLRTGTCLRGDTCQFAHGEQELQKGAGGAAPNPRPRYDHRNNYSKGGPNQYNFKTKLCKYFMKDGNCRYGSLCHHAHGQMELRQPGVPFFPGQFSQFGMVNPMMGMGMMPFPAMGMNGMNSPYMMPNETMPDIQKPK